MSSIKTSGAQSKSYGTMPPIIDLHATDLTALYSLLLFAEKQCRNLNVALPWSAATYQGIRDCLFAENKRLLAIRWISSVDEIFGFHRFANERKWTKKCSRNCLAPVSVGYIFSDKAYSHAIRGHFLSISALL